MTYLKKFHGPFEHVPKPKRRVIRGELKRKIENGACSCAICEDRIENGQEPEGWPEDVCWVRQSSGDNGSLPPGQRPAYVCQAIRTDPDTEDV